MKKYFIALIVLLILTGFACSGGEKIKTPPAENGVLDLSKWDFNLHGPAELLGQWKFKWQEDKPEFRQPGYDYSQWENIKVPGSWNDKTGSGPGYGWYSLKVLLPVTKQRVLLGLRIPYMFTSYSIYLDGVKFAANGKVGNTKDETRAQILPLTKGITLAADQKEVVLAIKVANFSHRLGGMTENIKIAPLEIIQHRNWINLTQNKVVLGVLLMMCLYHTMLFLGRREDKASLYFSLLCLTLVVRFFLTENYLEVIIPGADIFDWRMTIEYITLPAGWITLYLFCYYLFPQEISRRATLVPLISGFVLILFTLLTSPLLFSKLILVYNLVMLILIIFLSIKMVKAKMRGRLGAGLLLLGAGFFFFGLIHDILHANEVIRTFFISQFMLVIMIFFQSAVLSTRFAMAHRKSAKLSRQLGEVHEIGTKISRMQILKPLLEQAINDVGTLLKVRKGAIYIFDQKEEMLYNTVRYGWSEDEQVKQSFKIGQGVIGKSFESRSVLIVDDVNKDKNFINQGKDNWRGCKTMMAIPLNYQDETYGVLTIQDRLDSKGMRFDTDDRYIGESLATNVAIQIKNIELLAETADKARMDQELKTAQAVQGALFPDSNPTTDKIETAGFFESASETGGDWYGYLIDTGRYYYILIGDVTGHGTPAALVTSGVRSACSIIDNVKDKFDDFAISPSMILDHLNLVVNETGMGRYVMTFFIACFDNETNELTYSNAGHNLPLYYSKTADKVKSLVARGSRLGYSLDSKFTNKKLTMSAGDVIFFYTDGLIECVNDKNEEYGKRRFKKHFHSLVDKTPEEIKDQVIERAFNFFGEVPRDDDVTAVVLKINGN